MLSYIIFTKTVSRLSNYLLLIRYVHHVILVHVVYLIPPTLHLVIIIGGGRGFMTSSGTLRFNPNNG